MAPLHENYGNSTNTCPDFWQMIWETNSKLIVMLCEVQSGFSGCSKYFPTEIGENVKHGHFDVKCIEANATDVYIERSFELTSDKEKNIQPRKIEHLQFLKWPNYGVPDAVGPISEFIQLVHKKAQELTTDPEFVIHCSGGIGRSGTFLTAYGIYSYYSNITKLDDKEVKPLCLFEIVKSLRHQRHPWMVEGSHQYKMAYDISVHLLNQIIKIKEEAAKTHTVGD